MGLSLWQIAIVVILVVLLFGRGKISDLMGDVAKGIRSFRSGLSGDDDDDPAAAPREIENDTTSKSVGEDTTETRDETRTP